MIRIKEYTSTDILIGLFYNTSIDMASLEFSIRRDGFPCPNCNKIYTYSTSIILLGTCSHYVCSPCIMNKAILMDRASMIEVPCPIDDCCCGVDGKPGIFCVKGADVHKPKIDNTSNICNNN